MVDSACATRCAGSSPPRATDRARSWAGGRCGPDRPRPPDVARTALVQRSECRATSWRRSSRRAVAQGGRMRARSYATVAMVAFDLATHGSELRDRPVDGAELESLVKLGHASQQRDQGPPVAPPEVESPDADLVPAVRVVTKAPHASVAGRHLPPRLWNVTGGSGRIAPTERIAAASKRSAGRAAASACESTERGVTCHPACHGGTDERERGLREGRTSKAC